MLHFPRYERGIDPEIGEFAKACRIVDSRSREVKLPVILFMLT